jgi:CTP:molybdopterin cytidylyltransferase MocA
MDAIVTAGGIPQPDEPLYPYTQGNLKALLDVAGKPMVQWVLDALGRASSIERVVVVGLNEASGVTCSKPLRYLPNQGNMLENIRSGVRLVLEQDPAAGHVLLVSSDIPAITAEMVDWVVNTTMQTDHDIYYCVITRESMESRFPGSKRTYTRLKDVELCGGDMNVARALTAVGDEALWQRIIAARKSALKQAALLGFDTLFLLIFRLITLEQAAKKVSKRLGIKGRALVCPYPEIGMDVDKPHQLELLRADLSH